MKSHQEVLAEKIVEELKEDPSVVGIEICGSLVRGEIRPDSDIDFGVTSIAVDAHQFIEEFREGIKVEMEIMPLEVLLESVETHPFLLYLTLTSKILYDPKRIIKQVRERLDLYFRDHPEIVSFWKEKIALYTITKARGEIPVGYRSVLDEAELRFSESKSITRNFFQR